MVGCKVQIYEILQNLRVAEEEICPMESSVVLSSLRPISKSKLAEMNQTTFCEMLLACCDFWFFVCLFVFLWLC